MLEYFYGFQTRKYRPSTIPPPQKHGRALHYIGKAQQSLPKQIKDKRQVVGLRIPRSPLVLA